MLYLITGKIRHIMSGFDSFVEEFFILSGGGGGGG